MNELAAFDTRLGGLIASLEPESRRGLARTLAARLKAGQASRIAAQKNPDGSAYAPRKPQLRRKAGALRRRAMFSKLRTAKWLKAESSDQSAVVTFAAGVQRIAQVHQHGLRDRVNRRGLEVTYPARALLGLTAAEIADIEDAVLAHLSRG